MNILSAQHRLGVLASEEVDDRVARRAVVEADGVLVAVDQGRLERAHGIAGDALAEVGVHRARLARLILLAGAHVVRLHDSQSFGLCLCA